MLSVDRDQPPVHILEVDCFYTQSTSNTVVVHANKYTIKYQFRNYVTGSHLNMGN